MKERIDQVSKTMRSDLDRRCEQLMEQICDLCHHSYVAVDQENLDDICEECPISSALVACTKSAEELGKTLAYLDVVVMTEKAKEEVYGE